MRVLNLASAIVRTAIIEAKDAKSLFDGPFTVIIE